MADETRDPVTEQLAQEKLRAEIRKLGIETSVKEAEHEVLKRRNEDWHSGSEAARLYTFYGGVDRNSVRECIEDLGKWSRRTPNGDMRIIFNSPGGSVLDGLALYDYIQELRSAGHYIETVTLGMAASMGGVLLQAGERRVAGRNAHILIHEVSSLNMGKVSEMEDELEFCKKLQTKILDILAERSTMSKAQIKRRWSRKDWWIDSQEALDLGFIDEIRG
jgi:ATP-dependent Clp protease protease subunit